MPDPHWENLKEIFHAALALPSDERADYIEKTCGRNDSLRHAVESLLKSHEESNFLDTPAYDAAAEVLADRLKLEAGQIVGHYRIVSLLGEGGMGKVYLAGDTKLHRKVSLKFLSSNFVRDKVGMRRFEQEARAASALNHPNILTIHEIGEADGHRFIATEFIEGQTLRERLASGLDIDDALDIAIQVASALVAAHRIHIVHRDIKPENIMIRKDDGLVKVLDFGLAKMTARRPDLAVASGIDTALIANTGPGVVMGTLAYMSPEQARGEAVDERTDIWSLGVVLYEMVAGCSPFVAGTSNEIISTILSKQAPPPLTRYAREVPERLEEIVEKALSKNKDERYQTSKDLLIDLKRLKQTWETKAAVERSTSPDEIAKSRAQRQSTASGPPNMQAVSSAEYIVSQVKSHKRAAITAVLIVAVGVVIAGVSLYRSRQRAAATGATAINSLAVLPLVNVSGDPETEYLSDGITDSLINSLSLIPHLTVKARSSVFRYKGKEVDPQTLGSELGVEAILTGRLAQHGDGLTISLELVDARTGDHRWGEQYQRQMSALTAVQSEITHDVSEKLRARLSGVDRQRVVKSSTQNAQAYQLYLKGSFFLGKGTEDDYKKALDYFNQALELDPNYALAYVGIADYYMSVSNLFMRPKEALPRAKAAAQKAVALDDTASEAHATLGWALATNDWDWPHVEPELKRAIELNPNSSRAHNLYGWYLSLMRRHDEAIAEKRRALELDPLSVFYSTLLGTQLFYARRYDEAIAQLRQTIEMDKSFWSAYNMLGRAYLQKGDTANALVTLQQARDLNDNHFTMTDLAYAYAVTGKRGEAQQILSALVAREREGSTFPIGPAIIYAGLGDKEQALTWLQKVVDEHTDDAPWLRLFQEFDSMHPDPRFQELVRRVGLAP